jgi:hypothetical protein
MKSFGKKAIIPGLAPVDAAAVTKYSDVINMKYLSEVTFLVQFGTITTDSAVITVEKNSSDATGGTAIAFKYQKSSAVGTDNLGDVADAASTGLTITASDDAKFVVISVEAADLGDGYPYVNVCVDPGGSMTVCLVAIIAIGTPRYEGEDLPSNVG